MEITWVLRITVLWVFTSSLWLYNHLGPLGAMHRTKVMLDARKQTHKAAEKTRASLMHC